MVAKVLARRIFGDAWTRAYRRLRPPKTERDLLLDESAIASALSASPIKSREQQIEIVEYRAWMKRADYSAYHPQYYADNLAEKSLEHFFTAQVLDLRPGEVFIDVASQNGVAAEIFERLYHVTAYQQDLDYPEGVTDREIGGNAAAMPVPDGFANAMALHCSFEHFEGDSDTGFIREAARVLAPGGRAVIAPLYLCDHYACLTHPIHAVRGGVRFEPDMLLYARRDWHNRHGRFYDVPHLIERVWNARGPLEMEVRTIPNFRDVDPGCYLRYSLVLRKPAG